MWAATIVAVPGAMALLIRLVGDRLTPCRGGARMKDREEEGPDEKQRKKLLQKTHLSQAAST